MLATGHVLAWFSEKITYIYVVCIRSSLDKTAITKVVYSVDERGRLKSCKEQFAVKKYRWLNKEISPAKAPFPTYQVRKMLD